MALRLSVIVALVAGFAGLAGNHTPARATGDEAAKTAPWPTETWTTSTPEEQGMESPGLARLIEKIGSYKQDSFMIVRHGRIVAEAYYAPYAADIRHDLRSVTKSVIGTLTAIQLQKGMLASVDQPVLELFADKQIQNVDDRKSAITVQNLLDMSSGIQWTEKAYTPDETLMQMFRSPDPTAFVLDQPMAAAPGQHFNYGGGNPYLLSALITRKSGLTAFEFARKELFEPLGIKSATWRRVDRQGVTDGQSGLYLSPRDMAKFGYLYLRNGQWEGKQLIPSPWVDAARDGKVFATGGYQYGNLWWSLPNRGAYMALGRHSQVILVIPKLDIVAVMTGVLKDGEYYPLRGLINDISSIASSEQPLPSDPVGTALLANAIRQAATEKPGPVGETPALAGKVSGKLYRFSDNVLRVKSFAIDFSASEPTWIVTIDTGKDNLERLTGTLGLDGFYRQSPALNEEISAVRGHWLDQRTFEMERRLLGHGEIQTWRATFEGDKVTVIAETTDGLKAELRGAADN